LISLGPPVESPTSEQPSKTVFTSAGSSGKGKADMDPDYSRWVESDEDSSDDEMAFRTPTEGLSEVEEDDEEDAEDAVIVDRKKQQPSPAYTSGPKVVSGEKARTSPAGSSSKGVPVIDSDDVLGTGPSTIKRTKPGKKTQVVRHLNSSKESALSIDQDQLLAPDLDTCREALTLFLTSQMQKAEDLCTEKDPDANHLYLLSAGGIIQALKVNLSLDTSCDLLIIRE
jgi:hypothetical protein